MPTTNNIEQNTTQSLKVIDALDTDIIVTVQTHLAPLYDKYPFLANNYFDVPLANIIAATLIFFLILGLRKVFTKIILVFLQNLAKTTKTYYDDRIISALKEPIRFVFVIIALHLFFLLTFSEPEIIKNILDTLMVYSTFWALLAVVEALRGLVYQATGRFNKDLSKEVGNFIIAMIKIVVGGIGLAGMLMVWGDGFIYR